MIHKFGFKQEERLLIINADDLGITEGTNEAIVGLFGKGAITSSSIMMTCAYSAEAILTCRALGITEVGVHLTLTSGEMQKYTPVYQKRNLHSLVTDDGYFYQSAADLERNADPNEVRLELEAQIEELVQLGIDPTHLDSHGGSIMGLFTGRDYLEETLDLCLKYRLPFNLPTRIIEQPNFSDDQIKLFKRRISQAKERKIALIDDIIMLPYCYYPAADYDRMKRELSQLIRSTKPGITQLTVHPSKITDSLKAVTGCYAERELEARLLNDPDIKRIFQQERIQLVSWRDLRDMQRRE